MNAADAHFTITLGGLRAILVFVMSATYRLGRILQRIDSHIKDSNVIHDKIDERLTWLERRRPRNDRP